MSVRRFWLVARNELSFNARRPMFYICLAVLGLVIWGLSTGNVSIIIASGDATVGGKKAFITSEFAAAQILAVTVSTMMSFYCTPSRKHCCPVSNLSSLNRLRPAPWHWLAYTSARMTSSCPISRCLTWTA